MTKTSLGFCLVLAASAVVGCTQTPNADANQKRAYRSTKYTQVGTNIPGNYRDYTPGDDLSQSEQQKDQFQRLQTNGGTFGINRQGGGR